MRLEKEELLEEVFSVVLRLDDGEVLIQLEWLDCLLLELAACGLCRRGLRYQLGVWSFLLATQLVRLHPFLSLA